MYNESIPDGFPSFGLYIFSCGISHSTPLKVCIAYNLHLGSLGICRLKRIRRSTFKLAVANRRKSLAGPFYFYDLSI